MSGSEGENEAGDPEAELRAMLYGGERLGETVRVGEVRVAITSHRVLVLDPEGEPRFQEVALPNVTEAGAQMEGDVSIALQTLRYGLYAVVLFGVSFLVDFGAIINDLLGSLDLQGTQGASQVLSIINAVTGFVTMLDSLLAVAGLGVAMVALVHAVRYARTRTRALEIEVSGSDPVRVDITRDAIDDAKRVGDAVEKAKNAIGL